MENALEVLMLNESTIVDTPRITIKSEMIRQLERLKKTTPEAWERATFKALLGYTREDIDWSLEDNQAGYYSWIRTFDRLLSELIEDGYVRVEDTGIGDERVLVAVPPEPGPQIPAMR
jgi:hypothetical protein